MGQGFIQIQYLIAQRRAYHVEIVKVVSLAVPTMSMPTLAACVLHKNPAHQRKILSDPKNLPHQASIQLGPETLDLLVSPIYDKDKNYMGAMVTWEVITEKLAAEQKSQEMQEREQEQAKKLQEKVDSILVVVDAATEGDLTQDITVCGEDAIGLLGEGLSRFFTNLQNIIGSVLYIK